MHDRLNGVPNEGRDLQRPGNNDPFRDKGYAGLDGETEVHSLVKPDRAKLCRTLKSLTFRIGGLGALERGIVTAGGVDVKQINPKTMESKLIPNLYFAGELIDVDGLTGGFNIQIALSTGYLAGTSVNNAECKMKNEC